MRTEDQDLPPVLLLVEDDDDDILLISRALHAAEVHADVRRVSDGEELMNYLYRRPPFTNAADHPFPRLLLLDLNMPRKDGREVIRELRADPSFAQLPIVVLTTSGSEEDTIRAYHLGANSFVQKPVRFESMVDAMRVIRRFWFEVAQLPPPGPSKIEAES